MAELSGKRKGNKKKHNQSKKDTEFSTEVSHDLKTNSSTKKHLS